ncbi:MAG: DUF4160 domain-containing protein [Planctomycetes bacterium]|nr:DUF4160 domain-containing protein [Planctomycetota bacterium]
MPEISRFFGIVIAIFYNDHDPPHFLVRYGRSRAHFSIDTLDMIDGDLGPRAQRLVREWEMLHQEELRRDWELARAQQPLLPIAPLE